VREETFRIQVSALSAEQWTDLTFRGLRRLCMLKIFYFLSLFFLSFLSPSMSAQQVQHFPMFPSFPKSKDPKTLPNATDASAKYHVRSMYKNQIRRRERVNNRRYGRL